MFIVSRDLIRYHVLFSTIRRNTMRGKVFKRITASLMALAMVGTTLPEDIGGFQLFGGSLMTADAVDAVTYNLYNWNTETNKLDYTEKTVSSYNELTAEYLKERKYTLNGITASGEGGKVYISGGKMEITLRNSNSDGRSQRFKVRLRTYPQQ